LVDAALAFNHGQVASMAQDAPEAAAWSLKVPTHDLWQVR
jgi:hypothetical protein